MGQEIADSHFTAADCEEFSERLARETRLLGEWLEQGVFADGEHVGGFELEAWLVDRGSRPAPLNRPLLEALNNPLVVPELARFNLEINGSPQRLQGAALSRLAEELTATWGECNRAAVDLDARLAMIGILPTVEEQDLTGKNMSRLQRYLALDEQLAHLRGGSPLHMDISGHERLSFQHDDVMLESATTSRSMRIRRAGFTTAPRFSPRRWSD